jgi:hypothetical protein
MPNANDGGVALPYLFRPVNCSCRTSAVKFLWQLLHEMTWPPVLHGDPVGADCTTFRTLSRSAAVWHLLSSSVLNSECEFSVGAYLSFYLTEREPRQIRLKDFVACLGRSGMLCCFSVFIVRVDDFPKKSEPIPLLASLIPVEVAQLLVLDWSWGRTQSPAESCSDQSSTSWHSIRTRNFAPRRWAFKAS